MMLLRRQSGRVEIDLTQPQECQLLYTLQRNHLLQEPLQHRQTPACRDLLLYKPQHMFLLYEDHQGPSMQPGSLDLFTGRNISTTGVALWRHGWVGNSLNTKTGRSGGQRSFLYQGIWRVRQSGESWWISVNNEDWFRTYQKQCATI